MFPGIRQALMESPDHSCPSCETPGQSPDVLIPNKYLRAMVTSFVNETSYVSTKKSTAPEPTSSNSTAATSAPAARTVVLKSEPLNYQETELPVHFVGGPPQVTRVAQVKPEFRSRESQRAAAGTPLNQLSVPVRPSAGSQYGYQPSRPMGHGPAAGHRISHHITDFSQPMIPTVSAVSVGVVQSQSAPSLLSHNQPE